MNVYWSVVLEGISVTELSFYDPENLFKRMKEENLQLDLSQNFLLCPSVRDLSKKIYALKFPYNYNITLDREKETASSNMYDQNFFNEYVNLRSAKLGFMSFRIKYIFFSENDLEIEYTGPYFEENSFSKNVRVIPGKFDIGNWFRPLECSFIINKDCSELITKRGDASGYVKFCTDEDIKLIRFDMSPKLLKISDNNVVSKFYHSSYSPLSFWYKLFQHSQQRKLILKEIKNNLLV